MYESDSICGVPAERWIDWHLGKLPAETAAAMARHREGCPSCKYACRQWEGWLRDTPSDAGTSLAEPLPKHRRNALRARVWLRGWRRRIRQPRAAFAAALAALVLLLGLVRLLPSHEQSALSPRVYAERHEPLGAALMSRPDTVVYTANAVSLTHGGGNGAGSVVTVWVNGPTNELFVLLDGLLPSDRQDVQAWATVHDQSVNLGLLEFHERKGHLYAKDEILKEIEELAFTIEPKGGSLQPTAPESARVRLVK